MLRRILFRFRPLLSLFFSTCVSTALLLGCGEEPEEFQNKKGAFPSLRREAATTPDTASVLQFAFDTVAGDTLVEALDTGKVDTDRKARPTKKRPVMEPTKKAPTRARSAKPPAPSHTSAPKAKRAQALPLDRRPATREEAREWASEHYSHGLKLASKGKYGEAYKHAQAGLRLWENASLHVLRARCLNRAGSHTAAKNAADRALAKGGYWQPLSSHSAKREKIRALEEIYKANPSNIVKKELDETRALYQ